MRDAYVWLQGLDNVGVMPCGACGGTFRCEGYDTVRRVSLLRCDHCGETCDMTDAARDAQVDVLIRWKMPHHIDDFFAATETELDRLCEHYGKDIRSLRFMMVRG